MQAYVFDFVFDASGSADDITLPMDLPHGFRTIVLHPPSTHAWTFYGIGSSGFSKAADATVTIVRTTAQAAFQPGEVIGRAVLDTGSGTGKGLAS